MTASLIVTNARIWTGDPDCPQAAAMAVFGDRVAACGQAGMVDAWRGPATCVIDAGGRLVVPGFNDSHLHLTMGGMQLDEVDLRDAESPGEFVRRIAERAAAAPPGEWVLGGNWDEQRWPVPELPSRGWIDAVTGDTPVFVRRYDVHTALANSAALALAGIDPATVPPPGGEIPRDSQGYLTGIVKDAAMDLAARAIPPVTRERRLRAIRRALAHAAELGVTSVQDMGPEPESIALYAELAERAELSARIYAVPPISRWEEHARIGVRRAFGSNLLRLGGLKGFSDGSLGSRTAYFHEPYTDAPSEFGLLAADMQPPGKMRDRMLAGDAAGLQLLIHAIGDRAVSMVLDLFAEVEAGNGRAERRWRIEHAQHLAPGDAARFARLGVIASVQPCHAVDDGRWAESRIGPERASRAFAFRTLLDGGVRLAIGTDWPVAPLDPMLTLWAACAREWHREQRITLEEALRACTSGAAYAEYQEREKGMLRPGMLADFVVLSEDIFELAPEEIRRVRVERTFLGGRQVWPAS